MRDGRKPEGSRQAVRERFEGLNAYRGIAALLIVVFHTYQYSLPHNAVILVLLSVAAGALSYDLIERPATNLRYLFTAEGRLVKRFSPKRRS